ncbi:MAG: response regulator, partial [Saprospiraceae bacterium]|nr:response regulator [Saprospiraceae bacterium]
VEVEILNPRTEQVVPLYCYLGLANESDLNLDGSRIFGLSRENVIWVALAKAMYKYDGSWKKVFERDYGDIPWMPAKDGVWMINYGSRTVTLHHESSMIGDTFVLPAELDWTHSFGDDDYNFYMGVSDKAGQKYYLQLSAGKDRIIETRMNKLPKFEWFNEVIYGYTLDRVLGFGLDVPVENGFLWLKDRDGKFAFNLTRDYPQFHNSTPYYVDRQGGIWGANPNGLFRWQIVKNEAFVNYLDKTNGNESTRGLMLWGDELLVASYNGAKRLNLEDGSYKSLDVPNNTTIFCFEEVENGYWMGQIGGQTELIFLGDDGELKSYDINETYMEVLDILAIDKETLWIATRKGLFRFNIPDGSIEGLALAEHAINFIYENAKGFWMGTQDGLYLLDRQANVLDTYLKQSSELVYRRLTHIYEDETGKVWVTTSGAGLIYLDLNTGNYEQFTTEEGLSNDYVHAVYPDGQGNLWLSSDYGLMRFNIASKAVETFFASDGTTNNEYNFLSHYRAPDGRLFFGGVNGVTEMHPDDFPSGRLGNIPLTIVDAATFDLTKSGYNYQIKYGLGPSELYLRPSDSFLEIQLSSLLYEAPGEINYAWKLEGLQQDWIVQKDPNIRLSNLRYGTYQLQFTGFRKGNQIFEDYKSVVLHVPRPFYLTYPFLLLVLVLLLGAAWIFFKWRTRKLRSENLKLERLVRARTRQVEQDRSLIAQQADDLRRLNQVKTRFFANITHELRTPLALILGPLEQVMEGKVGPEKSPRHLSVIHRNAMRLLNLIEELLDLSKIEEKEQQLELIELRMYPFLKRMVETFSAAAECDHVLLSLNYRADQELVLLLDQYRWEKIIQNLLSNALKFTPAQGRVTLTFEERGSKYLLRVSDTGKGISPADLPHIFDRFYQGERVVTDVKGSGIGLSLVKAYCDLFGADLSVESVPGKGAVFTIVFSAEVPITPAKFTLPEQEEGAGAVPVSAMTGHPVLLIVEDEPDMQDFLVDILHQDYELELASNGVQALHIIAHKRVDLVLSDLMMPEMDGLELLTQAKKQFPDLPFILLTARADEQDKLQALTIGVDDYLTKPFKAKELQARLSNLVSRYEIRQALWTDGQNSSPETRFDQQWLKQLEQVVRDHLSNPDFSVLMLAEQMNVSERSLQYKTKAHTGINPRQFIVEIRLTEAMRLLQAGVYASVSEVCYAVGFKSTQYFAKLMKQRFGQSPSELLQGGAVAKNSDS